MIELISHSQAETELLGYRFGKDLPPNSVVCFFGDLAAGKTTFIRGLAAGVDSNREARVSSPTFVYLNIYEGEKPIYHFDLYRLNHAEEFLSLGFDEFFSAGGICCIEWSERITDLLPAQHINIVMSHEAENIRKITITPWKF